MSCINQPLATISPTGQWFELSKTSEKTSEILAVTFNDAAHEIKNLHTFCPHVDVKSIRSAGTNRGFSDTLQ